MFGCLLVHYFKTIGNFGPIFNDFWYPSRVPKVNSGSQLVPGL